MSLGRRDSHASVRWEEYAIGGFVDVDSLSRKNRSGLLGCSCFSRYDVMSSTIRRTCSATYRFKILSENRRVCGTAKRLSC